MTAQIIPFAPSGTPEEQFARHERRFDLALKRQDHDAMTRHFDAMLRLWHGGVRERGLPYPAAPATVRTQLPGAAHVESLKDNLPLVESSDPGRSSHDGEGG